MLLEELEPKLKSDKDVILGYRTGGNVYGGKYVMLGYQPFDSIGIISRTGYGKTVLEKRVYSHLFRNTNRRGIIFDLQSEDHHLSRYSNTVHQGFPKGETPFKLPHIKCYAPFKAKLEAHPWDNIFGITIRDTIKKDWVKLDKDAMYSLTGKGSALLASILREKEVDDIDEVISLIPEMEDNKNITNALVNVLEDVRDEEVFLNSDDGVEHIPDFTSRMKKEICVINFHQNEEFMGLYIGVILRNLYMAVREGSRSDRQLKPIVIIEEADLALNKENSSLIGCNKWVMEILRRARKYGFYLILSTQQASDLVPSVKNHIKTWIVGDLVPADETFFNGYFSEEVMDAIKGLDGLTNNYGAREWVIVRDRKTYEKFFPFNSPVQIHRI